MLAHGIIYQAISPTKRILYRLIQIFGASLITFAIVGIVFSYYPIVKEEVTYKPKRIGFGDLISDTRAEDFGIDPYFSIYIPKINARARVIPNVSPGNSREYLDALSEGVAHAKGTSFPGQGQLVYLFSHSTDSPFNFARYNAVFFLLRKLSTGDRVIIYFMGEEYEYVVLDKFTTSGADVSWLADKGQGERLILQTCDPPGTSINRLLVIAKPIGE